MSIDQNIAEIRARLAKAESERDSWRAAGKHDKYLESYFLVNALEHELDRLREQGVASAASGKRSPSVEWPLLPPGAKAGGTAYGKGERERLMAEYSITFFAQQYRYAHYRYDRFDDALSYARQQLSSPSDSDAGDSAAPARVVEAPDELQRRRMTRLGITYQEGVYRLGPYRYDRLVDAMRYARLGKDVRMPIASLS